MGFVSHTLPPDMRVPAQEFLLGAEPPALPGEDELDAWFARQQDHFQRAGWSRTPQRKPGLLRGRVHVPDDFDEPLDEFTDDAP